MSAVVRMPGPEVWEHEQVARFYDEQPYLAEMYDCFLAHAAEAHDAMPRPRYGQQGRSPELVRPERFTQLLGIDTMHQWHPIRQHWITVDFIDRSLPEIDTACREDLILANLFHDTGEPFSKDGDAQDGTPKDEEDEHRARRAALQACLKNADSILDRIEPILTEPQRAIKGRYFRLIEIMGYYTTAARAARLYLGGLSSIPCSEERMVCAGISQSVERRNKDTLQAARQYPSVDTLLKAESGVMAVAAGLSTDEFGELK